MFGGRSSKKSPGSPVPHLPDIVACPTCGGALISVSLVFRPELPSEATLQCEKWHVERVAVAQVVKLVNGIAGKQQLKIEVFGIAGTATEG